jgi:PAS domain-containing protein
MAILRLLFYHADIDKFVTCNTFNFGFAMLLTNVIKKIGDEFPFPLTLVEIKGVDQPLIYVNSAFLKETANEKPEVLGRNCRFLQGELTDKEAISRIRKAISNMDAICQDLINYKKDGEIFFNRLVLIPFKENNDVFYIGLQHIIDQEQFKSISITKSSEIRDKTLNPITAIMTLLIMPKINSDDKIKAAILRLRDYVLAL